MDYRRPNYQPTAGKKLICGGVWLVFEMIRFWRAPRLVGHLLARTQELKQNARALAKANEDQIRMRGISGKNTAVRPDG
jgi:hypothetical protein